MLQTMRPTPPVEQEAADEQLTPFRDRIAIRNGEYVEAFPRAAALEARILLAMHAAINGSSVHLRGLHSPQRFRDALVGLKNFPLADLCRLATSPTREPRAAVKAAAQELAAAIGYTLEPINETAFDAHAALTGMMETGAAFAVGGVDALRDGILEPHEARDLRPKLEEVKASVARWDGILAAAEKNGVTE
jgi:hypothetical protein